MREPWNPVAGRSAVVLTRRFPCGPRRLLVVVSENVVIRVAPPGAVRRVEGRTQLVELERAPDKHAVVIGRGQANLGAGDKHDQPPGESLPQRPAGGRAHLRRYAEDDMRRVGRYEQVSDRQASLHDAVLGGQRDPEGDSEDGVARAQHDLPRHGPPVLSDRPVWADEGSLDPSSSKAHASAEAASAQPTDR